MILQEIKRGIIDENPLLILALGFCPSLAISTSVYNGFGMGMAVTFVLACSNMTISLLRKAVPDKIRIPCFIVVIAMFVSVVQLIMKAHFPALDKQLGIFVPLIAVNCIILGRAESYAAKNNIFMSLIDGIVIGAGFTVSLCSISIIREVLGSNALLGCTLIPGYEPMTVFLLAPGGFFVMACVMGIIRLVGNRKKGI